MIQQLSAVAQRGFQPHRRFQSSNMGQNQTTKSSDEEEVDVVALQEMYKKFVTECPSGLLFLHEFKRFFGVDPTGEAAEYAERMFRAFDKNGVRQETISKNVMLQTFGEENMGRLWSVASLEYNFYNIASGL